MSRCVGSTDILTSSHLAHGRLISGLQDLEVDVSSLSLYFVANDYSELTIVSIALLL